MNLPCCSIQIVVNNAMQLYRALPAVNEPNDKSLILEWDRAPSDKTL